MSHNREKVTYQCDCERDHGTCGEEGVLLLDGNNAIDITSIYWKAHPGEPMIKIGTFTDRQLFHLSKLLGSNENEKWSDRDHEEIKLISK